MVHHGPPGGPYPGSSPEPWPRRPDQDSTEEYGQPSDPWGGQEQPGGEQRWGGAPSSGPIGGPGSPAGPPGYPYQNPPDRPGAGAGYPGPGGNGGYPGAGDYPGGSGGYPGGGGDYPGGGDYRGGGGYPGASGSGYSTGGYADSGYPGGGYADGGHAGAGYPGAGGRDPGYGRSQRHDVGYGSSPHRPGGAAGPPPGWTPPEPESMWAPPVADANWSTAEPVPPPKRSRGRIVVGVVATLLVLALGGVGLGVYLSRDNTPSTPQVRPTTGPSGGAVGGEESPEPTAPAPSTPVPGPTTDARFVETGQCVANEGTAQRPKLVIAECGPKTYEVLARIDERTTGDADAKAKCAKVKDYTNYYFFNSELDDLDFVLCLRER